MNNSFFYILLKRNSNKTTFMKLLASLTILGLVMAQSVTAQTNYTKDPESCTSIMVGKKATTDGSVITSHTCDSWYRT